MAGTRTGAENASPGHGPQSWRYRPEIDGLRSVAVLSVFLFHLDRHWLRGGFVGVDIFFVISGFLICGILRSDIDTSAFSIARFYQRRIARIAPAFFVVLLATLLAGGLIYSQQDFASLGVAAAAAAASVINIKLMVQGNYFEISPDAQPLLHYWSLAVEEQFYLFFPPLLYAVVRWTRRPALWMGVLGAVSFASCVLVTWNAPVPAFYLLPTRAWELLAGACAALMLRQGVSVSSLRAAIAGWIGAGLLLASFVFIADGKQFPGAVAAVPVVGTLAIFTAIEFAPAWSRLRRLLSHPVALFVGKRSYSLYLWHWPIFSFVDYAFYNSPVLFRLGLKLALCAVAVTLTYSLIETPARRYFNRASHRFLTFGGFALLVVAVVLGGIKIRSDNYAGADRKSISSGGIAVHSPGGKSIVVVGDSQGSMYGAELRGMARVQHWNLNILSIADGNEVPNEPGTDWPKVEAFLTKVRPDVVILAEAWDFKLGKDTANVRQALAFFKQRGARVVLLGQPPILPSQLNRGAIRAGARPPFAEDLEPGENRVTALHKLQTVVGDGVSLLDVAPILTNHDGSVQLIAHDGRLNYNDPHHLSDRGAALVGPALKQAIERALATP